MGSRWQSGKEFAGGDDYDAKWRALAAEGKSIHGEADFVCTFEPASVLDAGCGTGRVAIELAARGVDVVGVDLDQTMIGHARLKAPELEWIEADLATVDVGRQFDVVVMAGNVMIFVEPGTEPAVVANMARHVAPGGHLIAGFQLKPVVQGRRVRGGRGRRRARTRRAIQHVGGRPVDAGRRLCGQRAPRTGGALIRAARGVRRLTDE